MGKLVPPPPWATDKEWERYLNHTKILWRILAIGIPVAIVLGVLIGWIVG